MKTYPANGGTTYDANLTFDPSKITSEGPALSAAQGYAAQHHITYTSTTALLKQTGPGKPFRWKVGLVNNGKVRGYVMINAIDDTVAEYMSAEEKKVTTTTTTSKTTHESDAESTGKGLAHDVKKTFLGIGGDLEEFFTGDRTVDK